MSKHVSGDLLALYAGGDLPVREARTVADHVRECAACRAALAGFEEMRRLLSISFQEPAPRDVCEVRQRVISNLPGPSRANRWVWALAAAALVVIASVFALRRQQPPTASEVPLVAQLAPPLIVAAPRLPLLPAIHHARRKPQAGLRSVALITRADEPPLIRITTADRNVVILWESNTKGEKE